MTFVLATANPGKIKEMRTILMGSGYNIKTRKDLGIDLVIEETGHTFKENALLKARAICKASGLPAIADDSGLCVEALDGAPGLNSSSYGGEELEDEKRCEYLLEKMKNVEHRNAEFVCTIVCVFPDGSYLSAEGKCPGKIISEPEGSGGFGYDPVFVAEGTDRTLAQLTSSEKNTVSHRGAALRSFSRLLEDKLNKKDLVTIKRVGLFGGTFNPPHIGHEGSASEVARRLGLDLLIIVPSGTPPHKALPVGTPSADMRLCMTRMAFMGMKNVAVTDLEILKEAPSYTVDTVAAIKRDYPEAEIFLLVGTDMFLTLGTWRESEILLKSVTPVVFSRSTDGHKRIDEYSRTLKKRFGVNTEYIVTNIVDISSSQLREMLPLRKGTGYITDTIYSYIIKNRLYGAKPDWDWLRDRAYSMLDPARIPHVMGCEEEALRLAIRWGVDTDETREAAILHDITKRLSTEEHIRLLENNGISVGEIGHAGEKLLHSRTGAVLAKADFGVTNAVYDAIMWHTTGRARMSDIEKIIYLADYIEPNRVFEGVGELRELSYKNLNEAVIMGLELSIADMISRGIDPNRTTFDALDDLRS